MVVEYSFLNVMNRFGGREVDLICIVINKLGLKEKGETAIDGDGDLQFGGLGGHVRRERRRLSKGQSCLQMFSNDALYCRRACFRLRRV